MRKVGERLRNGRGKTTIRSRGDWLRVLCEANPVLNLLIETHVFGMGAAAINVLPREHGTKPALQGSAARVVVELGDAPAFAVWDPVKVGVKPVCQFPSARFVLREPA